MSDRILHIKELDPDRIRPRTQDLKDASAGGSKIVIIGKPGTGKSTILSSLLYNKRHIFPTGMVISGTEDSNGHYKKIFPDCFVFNKYDEKVLEDFVKRQKLSKQHLINPWSVLVLDDCTDDPKVFSKPFQQGMYKNGRHWKMLYILSLQYAMDIRPVIRTNIDGVFILREPNMRNRKCLWENYASCIPDFDDFCTVMDKLTDDYTAMYIDNSIQSNNIEDCVFWYKAEFPLPQFKLGCDEYWQFHDKRSDPNYINAL